MKKRKKKIKITLESVEKHLQEKLKDPKFAKIYYAYKAKLNAKKRLEEILKLVKNSGESDRVLKNMYPSLTIDQAITKILKEFVYKDNLPTAKEIAETIDESYTDSERRDLGKAIRKLIEGDRSV